MWDIHHEMKRRLVLGQKPRDIAADLGVHPQTVSNVSNSPIMQRELAIMNAARDAETVDIARHIQDIAPEAIRLVEEAIKKGTVGEQPLSATARLGVAERHLARAGYPEVSRVVGSIDHTHHLTSEDINELKVNAKKAAFESGLFAVEDAVIESEDKNVMQRSG
jgi:hypothetical protein